MDPSSQGDKTGTLRELPLSRWDRDTMGPFPYTVLQGMGQEDSSQWKRSRGQMGPSSPYDRGWVSILELQVLT